MRLRNYTIIGFISLELNLSTIMLRLMVFVALTFSTSKVLADVCTKTALHFILVQFPCPLEVNDQAKSYCCDINGNSNDQFCCELSEKIPNWFVTHQESIIISACVVATVLLLACIVKCFCKCFTQ